MPILASNKLPAPVYYFFYNGDPDIPDKLFIGVEKDLVKERSLETSLSLLMS